MDSTFLILGSLAQADVFTLRAAECVLSLQLGFSVDWNPHVHDCVARSQHCSIRIHHGCRRECQLPLKVSISPDVEGGIAWLDNNSLVLCSF